MGLEGGIDRKQLEALKGLYRKWTGDAVQFRFLVTLVLMALIIVAVELPLADRLDVARARRKVAKAMSTLSHDVRGYVEQVENYDPHVAVSPELVDWQAYVMTLLEHSTAVLISLQPKKTESKGVFQVLEMEVVARGSSYREFVDFVARLEHGERLMRVEKVRVEKHQTSMYLTCIIKGLVKSSASAAGRSGKDGATDAGEPAFGPPWPGAGEAVFGPPWQGAVDPVEGPPFVASALADDAEPRPAGADASGDGAR